MPSTSKKQANFMRAVAHSPKFAKQVKVPQSVGKDFMKADKKTKRFAEGGVTSAFDQTPPMGDVRSSQPMSETQQAAPSTIEVIAPPAAAADANASATAPTNYGLGLKKGGSVRAKKPTKAYKAGGSVKSSAGRGDGCAIRGKTKGRMV
jgi:hypothetical protein